jgi:hypothetical protein
MQRPSTRHATGSTRSPGPTRCTGTTPAAAACRTARSTTSRSMPGCATSRPSPTLRARSASSCWAFRKARPSPSATPCATRSACAA